MDLKDLKVDKQKQKEEEDIFIKKVLPEVQREMDIITQKYGVIIEPHLIITDMGITTGIRVKKKVEDNPYKRP